MDVRVCVFLLGGNIVKRFHGFGHDVVGGGKQRGQRKKGNGDKNNNYNNNNKNNNSCYNNHQKQKQNEMETFQTKNIPRQEKKA